MKKRLTDQQKIELVEQYKTGKYTCRVLSKEYGISGAAIWGLLKRRGIQINNDKSKLQRKYTLNEDYFDEIDTEHKAYFLGLLYADGYNNESRNCVQITLQEKDKGVSEIFNNELNSNRPLQFINLQKYKKNQKDCYRLSISSKKMSTRLKEIGCMQGKSSTLSFPNENIVPIRFIRHFIRGYFDGDGSFSFYWNKKCNCYQFCAAVVSTEDFCLFLKKF